MDFKDKWLEIALIGLMTLGLIFIFANRWQLKRGMVGRRVSQLIAVLFVPPLAAIMALEGKISSDALAGIFGAVLGYVLSPLARNADDSGDSHDSP